jgi:solute carrier family 25 (adenine nucleotide translocator) protein 4/5/6/31
MSTLGQRSSWPSSTVSFVSNLLVESIPVCISQTVTLPLERVKLLRQVQDCLVIEDRIPRRFTGFFDCATQIIANEGLTGLWRGHLGNCLRLPLVRALNKTWARIATPLLKPFVVDINRGYGLWFCSALVRGSIVGGINLLFVYPLDFAHYNLLMDVATPNGKYKYDGVIDVLTKTINKDGFLSIYAGFLPSLLGVIVYRLLYFGLYDLLKSRLPVQNNFWVLFAVGWGTTLAAGWLSYPFDTIRRKMMYRVVEPSVPPAHKYYTSMWKSCLAIYGRDGLSGFWAGALTNIVRAVLGSAVLAGYETLLAHYNPKKFIMHPRYYNA